LSAVFSLDPIHQPLRGTQLIEASAGTGKTYTITTLMLRLVIEDGLHVRQILIVTFTEAATEELRNRVRERLREALQAFQDGRSDDPMLQALLVKAQDDLENAQQRLLQALHSFDEAAIFTIHSFCMRMLQDHAFESNAMHNVALMEDQQEKMQQIVEDFWRKNLYEASEMFVRYLLARQWTPSVLASMVQQHVGNPFVRRIPDLSDANALSEQEESFRQAYLATREAWERDREEVEAMLLSSPALNRRSYTLKSIPRWCESMGQYLRGRPRLTSFKDFKRFTTVELATRSKKGATPPQHPFFDLCDALEQQRELLEKAFEQRWVHLKLQLFAFAEAEVQRLEREEGQLSFDALLLKLYHSLQGEKGEELAEAVRERFSAALIDEFQDTDPVQYAIFQRLFHHKKRLLLLIGDPKQAIYSFRGADIYTYMGAKKDADEQLTLGVNWRSCSGLVHAVNTMFSLGDWPPFYLEGIDFQPAQPSERADDTRLVLHNRPEAPMVLLMMQRDAGVKNDKTLQKGVAEQTVLKATTYEMIALLEQGRRGLAYFEDKEGNQRPLSARDLAVLVRTNKQATLLQLELQRMGVPSVIQTRESLFVSREALEINRVLRAVVEPNNDTLLRVALTTDMLGTSGSELFEMQESDQRWEKEVERFRLLHELWSNKGLPSMFGALLSWFRVRERLLRFNDGERRITNLLHLSETLQKAASERNLGMLGLLKWLEARRAEPSLGTEEDEIRLESDGDVVQIVTIHKSKGLEYSVVFCPFLWSRSNMLAQEKQRILFHDVAHEQQLTLDLGSSNMDHHRTLAQREELAEELRLMYVALTRARHRCYVYWGKVKDADVSAPAYLFHQPPEKDWGGGEDRRSGLMDRFKGLSDAALKLDLQEMIDASQGSIAFQELPTEAAERLSQPQVNTQILTYQHFDSPLWQLHRTWQLSSFTALSSRHSSEAILFAQEMPDHDELDENESPQVVQEPEAVSIFTFPRGARAGNFFHDVFQYMDFQEVEGESFHSLVTKTLLQFGFEPETYAEVVVEAMKDTVEAPLDPSIPGLSLSSIPVSSRLNEMEFYYPIRQASPEGLKRVLSEAGLVLEESALTLDALEFRPFEGFMKGFIDLIFVHDGKYYLMDYKSNHLGDRLEEYNHNAMHQAMMQHNYSLQYYLYVVALHRYLKARLTDYSYDTHFGGVMYLFLRGVAKTEEGGSYGVYRDRPTAAVIEALSEYFAQGGEEENG
jgi:exodeoxyribonuclease V beta subunit